ncbi:Serine/threonine-protein kinase [Trichostrongylus colubriformis]|uniref:Serine/threonine-protein kinase n=1 Tax=Trichostrongylus colubriformis TaxID=6319 RepID=A0AAN8FKU6_TRICO
MKVEPLMKSKDDEILKMEIFVLKKVQNSRHVCRCLASGKTDSYTYVVMSLLGKELSEIRRRLPNRKISLPSTLRISIQVVRALQDIHEAGFIHRDVKPSNLAMGLYNTQVCYVFDFGLARQILIPDASGTLKLREPRNKVMFRGTVRYCSLNVHQYKEQGRHDDLTDPYEWNKPGEKVVEGEGEVIKSDRAEADKDGNKDNNTVNEVDESVVTEERNTNISCDEDFAKEDTLEGL